MTLEVTNSRFVTVTHCFLAFVLLLAILLAFVACSSPKHLTDNSTSTTTTSTDSSTTSEQSSHSSHSQSQDSLVKTVTVILRDTIYLNSSSSSSITFANQGGTYNAKTGEATNVISVSLTEEFTQLQSSYKQSQEENTQLKLTISLQNDSISSLNETISSLSTQSSHTDIKEEVGLSTFQRILIYLGSILSIIYIIRLALKIYGLFQPAISPVNKILSWLP